MKNYSKEQIIEFLDDLEIQLEDIGFEREESEWNQYLGNEFKNPSEIDHRQYNLIGNRNLLDIVDEWKEKTTDEPISRRFELLKKFIIETLINNNDEISQIKTKIESALISFRPSFSGKSVSRSDITNIIRTETDRNIRLEAFKAETILPEEIEKNLITLIKLRNKYARDLNFSDYANLRLELNDISLEKLNCHFNDMLDGTEKIWKLVLAECKDFLQLNQCYLWDIEHYIHSNKFDIAPDIFPEAMLLKSFYNLLNQLGIDKNKLPIMLKYQDLPYAGLCFPLKVGKDIRILFNPKDGFDWYRVFYHEHGHAIHFSLINQPSYLLQKGDPYHFMEAMAILYESFVTSKVWLRSFLKNEKLINIVKKQSTLIKIYKIRTWIAQSKFEFEAYLNPDQNLKKLYNKLISEVLMLDYSDLPVWQGKAWFTTYPIYFQNYVLAELISAHIIGYFKSDGSSILQPDFFNFINKFFYAPGASLSWTDKIKIATTTEIASKSLLEQLLIYEEF